MFKVIHSSFYVWSQGRSDEDTKPHAFHMFGDTGVKEGSSLEGSNRFRSEGNVALCVPCGVFCNYQIFTGFSLC